MTTIEIQQDWKARRDDWRMFLKFMGYAIAYVMVPPLLAVLFVSVSFVGIKASLPLFYAPDAYFAFGLLSMTTFHVAFLVIKWVVEIAKLAFMSPKNAEGLTNSQSLFAFVVVGALVALLTGANSPLAPISAIALGITAALINTIYLSRLIYRATQKRRGS